MGLTLTNKEKVVSWRMASELQSSRIVRGAGAPWQETAGIASFGSEPGLRIFECPGCGSATSRLGTAKFTARSGQGFHGSGMRLGRESLP